MSDAALNASPRCTWVYVETEPALFAVGFYDPQGNWHNDSDHASREDARAQVVRLNGGRQ